MVKSQKSSEKDRYGLFFYGFFFYEETYSLLKHIFKTLCVSGTNVEAIEALNYRVQPCKDVTSIVKVKNHHGVVTKQDYSIFL